MADNGFMIVLNQDFGELPCVWDRFFADAVLNEGFLEQGVSAIFFIGEDGAQVAGGSVCGSNGVPESAGHQRQTDILDAFPARYHSKIRRTVSASSGMITGFPSGPFS